MWFQCRLASRNQSLIWLQAIARNFSLMALVFFSLTQISWSLNSDLLKFEFFVYFSINSLDFYELTGFSEYNDSALSPASGSPSIFSSLYFLFNFHGNPTKHIWDPHPILISRVHFRYSYFDLSMLSSKYICFWFGHQFTSFPISQLIFVFNFSFEFQTYIISHWQSFTWVLLNLHDQFCQSSSSQGYSEYPFISLNILNRTILYHSIPKSSDFIKLVVISKKL